MRELTELKLPSLASEIRPIDRSITRGELAHALLYHEALRSLGRFKEADDIRVKLGVYGYFVRGTDKANQQAGFFVIYEDKGKNYIIDRGWVPTYTVMQQYLLQQRSLDRVLTWMFANSSEAGIQQFPRQAEHPFAYAAHRASDGFVCESPSYAARSGEEGGHGAERRRQPQPRANEDETKKEGAKGGASGSTPPASSNIATNSQPAQCASGGEPGHGALQDATKDAATAQAAAAQGEHGAQPTAADDAETAAKPAPDAAPGQVGSERADDGQDGDGRGSEGAAVANSEAHQPAGNATALAEELQPLSEVQGTPQDAHAAGPAAVRVRAGRGTGAVEAPPEAAKEGGNQSAMVMPDAVAGKPSGAAKVHPIAAAEPLAHSADGVIRAWSSREAYEGSERVACMWSGGAICS